MHHLLFPMCHAVVEDNQRMLMTLVPDLNNCGPLGLQVNQDDLLNIVTDDFLGDVSDLELVQFIYDERECSLNPDYEEAQPQFNLSTASIFWTCPAPSTSRFSFFSFLA